MPAYLLAWWRWATNPTPLPKTVWFVEGLGICTVHGHGTTEWGGMEMIPLELPGGERTAIREWALRSYGYPYQPTQLDLQEGKPQ